MKESAGSADREMGIIEQSLEYKINKLKETGVGVFQNLFQREDMGIVIDTLTGVLNVIDGITGSIGFLGTALATVVADKGNQVKIFDVDEKHLKSMEEHRENVDYLPGVPLSDNIQMAYTRFRRAVFLCGYRQH